MPYGTLLTDTIKSSISGPVTFRNTSGTEVGTLCRAWVNFNGTGTVAIRASFNVSSITDNGTGDYTVNFTTALSDTNYGVVSSGGNATNNGNRSILTASYLAATTSVRITSVVSSNITSNDTDVIAVAVFR
jgi:hypothetical protein